MSHTLQVSKAGDRMVLPKVALVTITSPFEVGAERAPNIAEDSLANLKTLPIEVIPATQIVRDEPSAWQVAEELKCCDVDIICFLVGTWSEDHLVLEILERVKAPIVTWAMPGVHTGSLCGAQQICSVLKELELPYKFVYGELSDAQAHKVLLTYARAVAVSNRLRLSRFGLIGTHVKGMTEVAFDEVELRSLFGCSVVSANVQDLEGWMQEVSRDDAALVWKGVKERVGKVNVDDEEGLISSRIYLALKKFVKTEHLAGLTVQCYPTLMGKVCLAYSLLSEEGVVAGCEGDINSTVAMYMLYILTGQPVHNTDLLAVDEHKRSLILSHCGSGGFSLAPRSDDIMLSPVRLAQTGVCVLFPAKPGPVTMVNLVGRRSTYRMCTLCGDAVPTDMVFPGNPVEVKVRVQIEQLLDEIASYGFGHHWMVGYGHVGEELEQVGTLLKIVHVGY